MESENFKIEECNFNSPIQAVATKPEHVTLVAGPSPPPLVVMSVGLRTTINTKTHQNEVAMVSCLVHHEFPIDKAPPQPPFQSHFCGQSIG